MDYLRQIEILNPEEIKDKEIVLVGSGATGSYVALMLAQLGWGDSLRGQGKLRVFDGDVIEEHNLCNQAFEISQIGKPKVEALKELIMRKCGFEIEIHNEMVDENTDSRLVRGKYVFLLTDTMSSRKEIFEKHLKFSFNTDLIIETRMGLRDGRVDAFSPSNLEHRDEWVNTLYSDKEAEVSRCGASASIITTVQFLASLATQRVVHHFYQNFGRNQQDDKVIIKQPMWNEIHFSLYPESYYCKIFGEDPVFLNS